MQSDKRNTCFKYILLCALATAALASVSMAAIAGDRSGISVYGYSTDQGYQRQIYGGGNGVYRYYSSPIQDSCNQPYSRCPRSGAYEGYYQQPHPYYSPSPYGGYQPPYNRGYSEGYHHGYHQGLPSKPRHGTWFGNRRYKN
ncbi:MAG: hypothetical protein ACREVY_05290 [Gammaproteobacteria bacterium]